MNTGVRFVVFLEFLILIGYFRTDSIHENGKPSSLWGRANDNPSSPLHRALIQSVHREEGMFTNAPLTTCC